MSPALRRQVNVYSKELQTAKLYSAVSVQFNSMTSSFEMIPGAGGRSGIVMIMI